MNLNFGFVRVGAIAIVLAVATVFGWYWYGKGKPPKIDVATVENRVHLDAFVSDPTATIDMSVEVPTPSGLPSGATPTNFNSNASRQCKLFVSVRPAAPAENVRWVVVTNAHPSSKSESVTEHTEHKGGRVVSVYRGDSNATTIVSPSGPKIPVGSFDCGAVVASSRGSLAAALPLLQSESSRFSTAGPAFEIETPAVKAPPPSPPTQSRAHLSRYESVVSEGQAMTARRPMLVYPNSTGRFRRYLPTGTVTTWFSPASTALEDTIDINLRNYQILTDFPSTVSLTPEDSSWSSSTDLEPSITAVNPAGEDHRQTFAFLAGLALATAVAAAIALIQEVLPDWRWWRDHHKKEPNTASPDGGAPNTEPGRFSRRKRDVETISRSGP
jgi:hypothetical protein